MDTSATYLGLAEFSRDRRCTNQTCHCHIGYIHLEYLQPDKVFGCGILERIPDRWSKRDRIQS